MGGYGTYDNGTSLLSLSSMNNALWERVEQVLLWGYFHTGMLYRPTVSDLLQLLAVNIFQRFYRSLAIVLL